VETNLNIGRRNIGHSPPLRIMFTCLKTPVPREQLQKLADNLQTPGWDEVARLAIDRHRVGPRVWSHLKAATGAAMPPGPKARFDADARQTAQRAMALMAQTARVIGALNQVSIEPVLLKGWSLEEDLFGSIARRVMSDIDLMVPSADLPNAATALRRLGYRCEKENLFASKNRLDFYLRFEGDVTFHLDRPAIKLELHARPFQNAQLLPTGTLQLKPKTITMSGSTARYQSLDDPSCFLYLALHGYSHRWERAKWLCDIPPLLQRMTNLDWQTILIQAKALKVEGAAGTALVLANKFLETPIPPIAQPLLEKAEGRIGTNIAMRHIVSADMQKQRLPLRNWLEAHAVYFGASRRPRAILQAIKMRLVIPSDIANSGLPDRLLFLHYPLSLLKWPWRIARHLFVPGPKHTPP